MTITSSILRIGNSCGIIIPAKILKSLSLTEKDTIRITEAGGKITLQKVDEKMDNSPFALLDIWCDEHGYSSEDDVESALEYVETIRKERKSKEFPQW